MKKKKKMKKLKSQREKMFGNANDDGTPVSPRGQTEFIIPVPVPRLSRAGSSLNLKKQRSSTSSTSMLTREDSSKTLERGNSSNTLERGNSTCSA